MQYEIIATVRLVIIEEILGLIAAELRRSVQICNFSRHSSRKRSTTRQLLDVAANLAVPRQDGRKQVLFETSYGVRRYLIRFRMKFDWSVRENFQNHREF